jgi:hypothetical protein
MMLMYALERRGPRFILAFALGCVLSSLYGFLSGAWPFGIVEAIWAAVALHRFRRVRTASPPAATGQPPASCRRSVGFLPSGDQRLR